MSAIWNGSVQCEATQRTQRCGKPSPFWSLSESGAASPMPRLGSLRSDSLGTLLAMRRSASRAVGLNLVLQELALEQAELSVGF